MKYKYWPVVVTLFVVAFYVFYNIVACGGVSGVIFLAKHFVFENGPGEYIKVWPGYGYDGQFILRLALDPFTNKQCDYGICLDNGPYRQQRILYPLLSRVVTFGDLNRLPEIFIQINVLAMCVIAWCGVRLTVKNNISPVWAMLFVIYPGLYYSISRDLTEVLEVAFLLISIVLIEKKWVAALFLSAAVLTRETALIFAACLVFVMAFQRKSGWWIFLSPVVIGLAWQIYIRWSWGGFRNDHHLLFPFTGALQLLQTSFSNNAIQLIGMLIFGLVVMMQIRKSTPSYLVIAWLLYTGMLSMLGNNVWVEPLAYMRVSSEWAAIGTVIVINKDSDQVAQKS